MLLTRIVAIIPAFIVCFLNQDNLTSMDNWLNNLQAIMLPFAIIPLLKFVHANEIMGKFDLKGFPFWFAAICGFVLFVANFVPLFTDGAMETW